MNERSSEMLLFLPDTLDYSDKQKLTELYEKHSKRMFSAANAILKNEYEAEDAVHNAFVSVAKMLHRINDKDEDAMCGYLFTVVKNEAYMILRKRRNDLPFEDSEELIGSDGKDIEVEAHGRDAYNYAVKIITEMDDTYRGPLYLTVVMGYSEKEAAKMLKRSESTVRTQISRAKKMVADKLKEAGYGT